MYLRGPTFTIRTDHASLQFIKTLTSIPDQMFRWILTLEEYSYKIEVRAGKLHANADTLSRIPCNGKICICTKVEEYEKRAKTKIGNIVTEHVLPETSVAAIKFLPRWSPTQIAKYQAEDHDLKAVYKAKLSKGDRPRWNEYSGESPTSKAYFAEWKRLQIWNDVLYRRWENGDGTETRLQLVVPTALQKMICEQIHDGKTTCHLGKKRTLKLMSKAFYWHKMDRDIGWWLRTCQVCQKRKHPVKTPKAPVKTNVTGFPNERVAMDVMGPLKETKQGNKYILCITDHFSKFTRAVPMPDQVAKRVAEIFVNEWVLQWGEPHTLHTDQGTNFQSELLKHVCELLQIEQTRTSTYHPQGNAQVERYNQTVMSMVAKLTQKDALDEWDRQLPAAVAAYNATEHNTTGFTPNKLMINREVRHNFDKMLPDNVDAEKLRTWDEYVQEMDASTRAAFQAAREAIGRSVKLQKKYYDRTTHLNKYKVGDTVMMRDHRKFEAGEAKLVDKYDGPYFVLDVLSDVNFRIAKHPTDPPRVIHHDRLKPIEMREKPDTEWVFKLSKTFEKNRATNAGMTGQFVQNFSERLTNLERQIQKAEKKKRRTRKPRTAKAGTKEDTTTTKRRRGRPKKDEAKNKKLHKEEGVRRSDRLKKKNQP